MKKDFNEYQASHLKIKLSHDHWLQESLALLQENHLICFGKIDDLQWFGTHLIQKSGQLKHAETGVIYGKLAPNFDAFCHQLCHSTPWGFEMGRNANAVNDVLRGENAVDKRFLIWYDADVLCANECDTFKKVFDIMLERAHEAAQNNRLFRVILLFDAQNMPSLRKLLKHKEKHPIAIRAVVAANQGIEE